MSDFGLLDLKILDKEVMLEAVKLFPKPEGFMGEKLFPSRPTASNIAVWDVILGYYGKAGYIAKGSEAKLIAQSPIARQLQEVAYKKEKIFLDANDIRWRRQPGSENFDTIESEIAREQEHLSIRLDVTNEDETWKCLRGTLSYTLDNGSTISIDYGIPASNKITITVADNKWSNTSAKILAQLRAYKQLCKGVNPTLLIVSPQVMDYLISNTQVQEYCKTQLGSEIAKEGKITRLAGLEVIEYNGGWTDENGTWHKFLDDKEAFIVPSVCGERLVASCKEADWKGQRFLYSWEENKDRQGTWILGGEYSLPALRNPYGVVNLVNVAST